jgi:heme exporter protein A
MLQLHVESLSKRYGPRRVLEDLSFTARAGSVLVVTGPNGAGKSTLLRCLAGLERPGRGRVSFRDGEREWGRNERRLGLGFLSPELALYEELTGRENLDFFALMKGLAPGGAGIPGLLEGVGLGTRGGDRVGDYSSGMRQRLKWAFALLGDPAALLLDEPGVTLDAEGFAAAAALVARARSRGRLVVLATNDTRELELGDERLTLG